MLLNPNEIHSYLLGLASSLRVAKRYKGIDMSGYIGEIEELIDQAENIPGYREWLDKKRNNTNDR